MRKHAILSNGIVTSVVNLADDEIAAKASSVEMIADIEDVLPEPEVGWKLEGNKLIPSQSQMTLDQADLYQQTTQRKFGLKLLPVAVDLVGARNLKLYREGTNVDVATLAGQMASIKLLMEGGALKTVRSLCSYLKPSFPNHADILDTIIVEITNFLTSNDWN